MVVFFFLLLLFSVYKAMITICIEVFIFIDCFTPLEFVKFLTSIDLDKL